MRVVSINVNGIRASFGKGLGSTLAALDPDLVCLQEVRALEHQLPELLPGYESIWHLARKPGYSGVGILSRRPPDEVTRGIGLERYDSEGRVLLARWGGLRLLNVYVPSGTTGDERQAFKMRFLCDLALFVRALIEDGGSLLLCGDLNIAHRPIDLKNWRSNTKTSGFLPEEREWLDGFLALGLRDVVRELVGPDTPVYSWWSLRAGARARNVGWRLDYQLATPDLGSRARTASIPREPILSDHAPVVVDYAS